MADRVKAAADARTDSDFYLIARTDAIASHGVDAAIERALAASKPAPTPSSPKPPTICPPTTASSRR